MDADSFHRVAKVLADSGDAATIEAAEATLTGYGVRLFLGVDIEHDAALQTIALTVINTAARTFVGNVRIEAPNDPVLSVLGYEGWSLSEFSAWAGVGKVSADQAQSWPEIHIGPDQSGRCREIIRPWADGWRCGLDGRHLLTKGSYFAPACVAAGGLAVSEAFSLLRRDNPYAGRREISLSLWTPGEPEVEPPPLAEILAPSAWLVGLGHLGQAYAWTLGFMKPADGATLVLQDVDIVTSSTLSTSVLSTRADINCMKTRVVARWLEERGYITSIVERRFDEFQRVAATEPKLALFGVDNAAARRVAEGAGFHTVIDVGLGSGFKDFRAMRLRTFPGPSSASALWAAADESTVGELAPAYQSLLAKGVDPCGVTTLMTRAVGAPFVGCVAAAFALAELLRRQIGARGHAVVDLNLRDPASMQVVPG